MTGRKRKRMSNGWRTNRRRGWIGRRRYHGFEQPLNEAERKRDAADKEITRLKPLLAGEKNIGKLIDVCDDISCFGGEYLDSAKEVKAISQGLEEFDKLTPELEEENKDADGRCQYWDAYATNPCGDPTVEGTRFWRVDDCEGHVEFDCTKWPTVQLSFRTDEDTPEHVINLTVEQAADLIRALNRAIDRAVRNKADHPDDPTGTHADGHEDHVQEG